MRNWKNSLKTNFFSVLILVFILVGCSSKSMVRKYYLIEIPAQEDTLSLQEISRSDAICEVREIEVNKAFAGNEIALRSRSHEISYYAYHQWAVKPGDVLREILTNQLENRKIFSEVSTRFWGVNPDYSLRSRIRRLEIAEEKERLSAHLDIEFLLYDNNAEQVVVIHKADRYVPLKKKSVNLFAAQISTMLNQEINTLIRKMVDKVNYKSIKSDIPEQP